LISTWGFFPHVNGSYFPLFSDFQLFSGLSTTDETLVVEMRIWCIKIGNVFALHSTTLLIIYQLALSLDAILNYWEKEEISVHQSRDLLRENSSSKTFGNLSWNHNFMYFLSVTFPNFLPLFQNYIAMFSNKHGTMHYRVSLREGGSTFTFKSHICQAFLSLM
jgi:hypothetical protein